ncbi:hypothetical protein ACWATR_16710 [Nostoc sp. UIC 10890]
MVGAYSCAPLQNIVHPYENRNQSGDSNRCPQHITHEDALKIWQRYDMGMAQNVSLIIKLSLQRIMMLEAV